MDETPRSELAETINTKYEQVKTHLQEKKRVYLVGTGCFVAGAAAGVIFKTRPTVIYNNVMPHIAPVFNNVVNNGGHMRKIVRCIETDELWPSVSKAAAAQGKQVPLMSQHLNHPEVVEHINDLHFVIEGLATGAA